ncbi:Ldh family oxidoreductase [Hoeflea sp. TYP-13]|uniref:Ldh family oxidoreductase n=1 Tax=Hoeflea sp. TYP-13 TaxID=3230023 RepID=UPI0034C603CE
MSEDNRFSPGDVRQLISSALVRSNTSEKNAASVADALLAAELAGQSGHGLRRVGSYAAQAACGKVDGQAEAGLTRHRPGSALVDAANGFAYPAIDLARDWLAEVCPAQGIAVAGITRSHHCGVAGVIVESLADKGLVALLFANTPAAMAPWGATRALFGTNPIAFSAPVAGGDPVTVDISLSRVARGKIMAANQRGEDIPEGWAFDADGAPTTDAKAALAGTMAPLGDAKGTVMALMVELICAGLTGANYSFEQSSFLNAEGGPPGAGQTLIAIDPGAFGVNGLQRFAMMAQMIQSTDGARLPGRRRQQIRRDYENNGIPVDPQLFEAIEAIGA